MIDAITFIRLNSKRLPRKSIKELDGIPLCNYSLKTFSEINLIDNIYVYASDESICNYISDGIDYKFIKRDKKLDGDEIKFNDVMNSSIDLINSEYVLYFCVTSPFIYKSSIEKMIDSVVNGDYDSAFMVNPLYNFAWYDEKPLNYNINDIEATQSLKPILVENSGIYLFNKQFYKDTGRRIGNKPFIMEGDIIQNVDIDTREQFELASSLLSLYNKRKANDN